MKIIKIFPLFLVLLAHSATINADVPPTISPRAVFETTDGEEEAESYSGSAPLTAHFYADAANTSGWSEYYEWRFIREASTEPFLIRYEENTSYTFTQAGATRVMLYAKFAKGDELVEFTDEYWSSATPIIVSISESKLEMPNAFSPNADGINDTYKPKVAQSLIEFTASIYNRWGQKLYEWTDYKADGWDGKFHGKDVAQGVYFCLVKAKGADGRKYNIKRDVNLLRGYTESSTTTD